ncbi:TetR/AcrR family transcriptional regulator [Scytonema tolypothrichoides VB-61278]|nr:TetR/AcrR family transcriptional regulator [Scytonema tolypothrichoides VB-61278]
MPKIVDHDQYRKELLSKCFDLFAQKSYSAITMREIAQGIGVSTGTLYHYFPSKKALFEQLVEEISQQDVLMAAAELQGTQTLQERMEAFGRFLAKNEDYFIKQTLLWVDFCQHQDSKDMQNSSGFKRAKKRYHQAVSDFLGIHEPVLISLVLNLIDGLILEQLLGPENISMTEQFALLGKMLTAYLEKQILNISSRN